MQVVRSQQDMGDTVEAQHVCRLSSLLQRQERVLPLLKSKLAAATRNVRVTGEAHSLENRIRSVEHGVDDYLFSVMDILRESGRASDEGHRGEMYARYVMRAGSRKAQSRLQERERADRIEQMMATGTGRKRRGLKRKALNPTPTLDCVGCGGQGSRFVDSPQAAMVCRRCGLCETFLDCSQACMPFGMMSATPSSEYKRLNHFTELLAQAQGVEKAEVPQEMIERVRHELAARKITDPALITRARVRQYLKRIKCVRVPVPDEAPRPPGGKTCARGWRKRKAEYETRGEVDDRPTKYRKVDGSRYYKHTAQIAIALGGRQEVMIPDRIHQRLCRLVSLFTFCGSLLLLQTEV